MQCAFFSQDALQGPYEQFITVLNDNMMNMVQAFSNLAIWFLISSVAGSQISQVELFK